MSVNKIETIHDTVLKVSLVFFDIVHELPYEGPCRFGKGMELERQFDEMIVTLFSNDDLPCRIFEEWFRKHNDVLCQEAFAYETGNTMVINDLGD